MVEEGCPSPCRMECLGEEVAHTASGGKTFHRLCRDDDRVCVFTDQANVGEWAGKVDCQSRLFRHGVGRLGECEGALAVEV